MWVYVLISKIFANFLSWFCPFRKLEFFLFQYLLSMNLQTNTFHNLFGIIIANMFKINLKKLKFNKIVDV